MQIYCALIRTAHVTQEGTLHTLIYEVQAMNNTEDIFVVVVTNKRVYDHFVKTIVNVMAWQ